MSSSKNSAICLSDWSSWAWIIFFNGHGIRIGEMLATDAFVLVAGEMQSNLGPSAETRLVLIGKDVRRSTSYSLLTKSGPESKGASHNQ